MCLNVSYSVIKMADDSEITTLTHYIPVDVFLGMIESDIKKLIHEYGHKNCGLMHKELCKAIHKIVTDNKRIVSQYMDTRSKTKWSKDWDSQRSIYFNKLFQEEGFINMCYPFKNIEHQDIYQLLSRHVNFCKEKDKRRSTLGENPSYSECVEYNSWIESEKSSFFPVFLQNVSDYSHKIVKKYFSTKEHPQGHDPRSTYLNSKLNCRLYEFPSKKKQQKPVVKASPDNSHPSTAPNDGKESQGKDGSSLPGRDGAIEITESNAKKSPQSEPPTSDSHTYSRTNTMVGATANGQHTDFKSKDPGTSVNKDGKKKESPPVQNQPPANIPSTAQAAPPPSPKDAALIPIIQSVPQPTTATSLFPTPATVKDTASSQAPATSSNLIITQASSLNSDSSSPSDPIHSAIVTKDKDTPPRPTTTPVTSPNTHSNQTIPEPSVAVSSLALPQPPAMSTPPPVTSAQGPATPSSSSASTVTNTVTITTTAPPTATITTMRTTQNPISFSNEAPGINGSQEPPPLQDPKEPKTTVPITVTRTPTPLSGVDTGGVLVTSQPDSADGIKITTLSKNTPQQSKDSSLVSSTSLPEGAQPNDKPSITSTKFPPLTTIIPTIIIILAAITLLFQLYKYTPFGFLLGRRRKRRKRDLRSTFVIPEESTYESPNITMHEWEDPNLIGQTKENDVFIKLLKINKYKQEIQKRKKENKKTLIEVHIEVLEEYKKDEWELHKGDFLEICLHGFINEENDNYSKLRNTELTAKSTKNDKIIENIQKHEILWNNWIENHRNILEQWKKEDWFQNLKNKWRNEEKMYKEKNNKLQENILNEQETYSIVRQKEIWKQWISKQATLIDMFNKEDWFKSIIYAQDKEKDNCRINEYNNISVTSKTELRNEKTNEGRSKNIIQKLMVQIHMLVLEECIKEDIIKHKELCIDNFIEEMHNNNNYDEKRNIPQCDTDDFNNTTPDFPCIHAPKCATIYKDNIISCSDFEDEFCKKLKAFRDILMNQLLSRSMCADQQDIIFSIDKKMAESTSQNQREEFSQATTISAASFGTVT
ncbi:STP1 protein [Plasmodium ovale wallikeri]|uniref:STP1 protein n=1 Tax=Plasmodium ovale wallikeri TaxID=864142 RepID=A0A1A9AR38_PLAOA|nr:STP1 protein [Plasmodium ovale wallikeri]